MSLIGALGLLRFPKINITPIYCAVPVNRYAAPVALGKLKKGKKAGAATEKRLLPVEKDTHKLVKFVCGSNILKEGGQDVEIKPDSEYPDWLWEIRTGPAPPLSELDPNTKAYWRRVRRDNLLQNNARASTRKF
ncbi:39S ribosomal protein L54, mitochondrial [Venturia canescens]|uniref:39S ribosomal protein L54, mitochondrial n=1 Tax=Venturia canescens TaxID=32260 RepID=UPI001C9D06D5|nr:39S ribosomal protein L54, mitochondrial [Venturia canescens]